MNAATLPGAVRVTQEFVRLCGDENVLEDPASLAAFAIDEVVPALAVAPRSEEELVAVLRICAEQELITAPCGGFTQQTWGAIPERVDVLIQTRHLNKIEFCDPGDLTIGCGSGCTAEAVQQALAANSQFLPLEEGQGASTIGGILAQAGLGPLAHGYGGAREFCIGIRFVTGDGKVAHGGGRVVKNVTGYDLMKLLIGSHGTLGVITSANFKVFPQPRQTLSFLMEFATLDSAIAMRDAVLRSPLAPIALELVNSRAQEFLSGESVPARDPDHFAPERPLDRSGAEWRLILRAAGSDAVLRRYRSELGGAVCKEIAGDDEQRFWVDFSAFVPNMLRRHQNAMALRISAPAAVVHDTLIAAECCALENNLLAAVTGRAALAHFLVGFVPLAVDPPSAMQYAMAISALRAALPTGASAIVVQCPTEAKRHFDVWGPAQTHIESMRAVRRALDPKLILNRGRFID